MSTSLIAGTTLLNLCRHSECCHSVSEFTCASPVVSACLVLLVSSTPTYLTFFPFSLLQSSLNLEGRDLEMFHLGVNVPKSLCTLLSCGSLSLFPSATGRSFCGGG